MPYTNCKSKQTAPKQTQTSGIDRRAQLRQKTKSTHQSLKRLAPDNPKCSSCHTPRTSCHINRPLKPLTPRHSQALIVPHPKTTHPLTRNHPPPTICDQAPNRKEKQKKRQMSDAHAHTQARTHTPTNTINGKHTHTHSLTHSLAHPPTHTLIHSLTHPLTHHTIK